MLKLFSLTIALVASLSSDVLAMKSFHEMVPGNLGTRFNLSKSESADGTWFFTLTRNTPPALSRHASLSILDNSGTVVANMELAPIETKDGGSRCGLLAAEGSASGLGLRCYVKSATLGTCSDLCREAWQAWN